MSTPITVVARASARPGQEAALERELRAMAEKTHKEEGCLRYALHRGADDRRSFLIVERWASREAFQAHMQSPHAKALMLAIPGLLSAAPEITPFESVPAGKPEKGLL